MIDVEGLKKSFGKLTVLDDLDLEIQSGGIFVIVGPNGSGKTTLIKSVLGMVVPDAGKISIDGKSVIKEWEYRGNIDYLPQIANFPSNLSVSELLKLVKELRDKPTRDQELIELFGLEPFLDKKLGNLSGGTKQKVNIVLTFMFNSDLVILDEPTSGLDPNQLVDIRGLIKELGKEKTVIFSSHIMQEVQALCDRVIIINNGKLVANDNIETLRQKVAGEKIVTVEFSGAAHPKELQKIGAVKTVRELGKNRYQLSSASEHDIRADIFRFAVSKNLILLEMHQEESSIEDIFQILTKS